MQNGCSSSGTRYLDRCQQFGTMSAYTPSAATAGIRGRLSVGKVPPETNALAAEGIGIEGIAKSIASLSSSTLDLDSVAPSTGSW